MTANIPVGAQQLYLMDLSGENLPNLKSTIEERYPDVTVRTQTFSWRCAHTSLQVTVIQADAADDKAISDVCHRALREQGRLDIFFANVRARGPTLSFHITGFFHPGWGRFFAYTGRDIRRDVQQCYANKRSVVSA